MEDQPIMNAQSRQRLLSSGWMEAGGTRPGLLALAVVALLISAAGLVYFTGGTRYAYLHAMYLPIILSAVVFKVPGGILAAITAGLLVGPFMPIDVANGIQQPLVNWVSRLAAFVIVGAFAGWIAGRLIEQVRHLRWTVIHDLDTGLPNRRALSSDLHRLLVSDQGGTGVHLLVLRIENLAEILNTLGYDIGTSLTRSVAERLLEIAPSGSQVYQIANDRLAAVVPVQAEASGGTDRLATTVLDAMRVSFPADRVNVHASVSLGIAHLHDASRDPDAVIRRADIALLSGQQRGQRYALYDIQSDSTSRTNLALMGELLVAIRENQLCLHYQPKMDLATGRIQGVEALVRWQHPVRGLVPPGDFIPKAENTDLILPLSRWVIKEAVRQLAEWRARGFDLTMAVNLSVKNLYEASLLDEIQGHLKAHGLGPECLELEVTESAIMEDPESALDALRQCRDVGVRLSIDDFGTGYSSLSYLHEIPADTVKIDRSFIRKMLDDRDTGRIVESTIALCRHLGMDVVAEGVTNQKQMDVLAAFGCNVAQGFYIERPMETPAFEAWFTKGEWPQPGEVILSRSERTGTVGGFLASKEMGGN